MRLLTTPFLTIHGNRTLLLMLSRRNLAARHKGSWLGRAWLIFQPLLLLTVYTFVFSQIYHGRFGVIESETGAQYALGIFFGLIILHFFNDSLSGSVNCIVGNQNYVKRVVFPLEILPVSLTLENLYSFCISMLLALMGVLLFVGKVSISILWLPVLILPCLLFTMGVAWSVSAFGVFYRDIGPVVQIFSICMLWMSGVFFSARDIPEAAWNFLRFNPILLNIELCRDVVLWNLQPDLGWITYIYLSSISIFFLGFWVFRSLKRAFADVM